MRYNVQNPKTGEWRCFSGDMKDWATDWMSKDSFIFWLTLSCSGGGCEPLSEETMTVEEAERIIAEREELE